MCLAPWAPKAACHLIPSYLREGRHLPWPKLGNSRQNNLDGLVTLQEKRKNNCLPVKLHLYKCISMTKQVSTAVMSSSWLDDVSSHNDNLTLEELFTADMLTSRHRKGKMDLITFNGGSKCPSKVSKWASMQNTSVLELEHPHEAHHCVCITSFYLVIIITVRIPAVKKLC